MRRLMKRFLREDDGMELLEWAIVAVLFALAGALSMDALGVGLQLPMDQVIGLFTLSGS
jgi:Flp pilus assembly pilin Flp